MTAYKVKVLVEKVIEINDELEQRDHIEEMLRDWFHETLVYRDEVESFKFEKQASPSYPHYTTMKGILNND